MASAIVYLITYCLVIFVSDAYASSCPSLLITAPIVRSHRRWIALPRLMRPLVRIGILSAVMVSKREIRYRRGIQRRQGSDRIAMGSTPTSFLDASRALPPPSSTLSFPLRVSTSRGSRRYSLQRIEPVCDGVLLP